MNKELLRIERLDYINDSGKILDNIKLNVNKGEVLSLLGSNGAGKSLILKILKGDIKCNSGLFYFNEQLVNSDNLSSNDLLNMYFIEGDKAIFENSTALEYIYILRKNNSLIINKRKLEEKYRKLCDLIKINIDSSSILSELNKIDRLIIQIVKAVSQKSELIIIDDLLLDVSIHDLKKLKSFFNTIKNIGTSIMFSTRHIEPYINFSDRFIVIRQGMHALTVSKESFEKNKLELACLGFKYNKNTVNRSVEQINQVFLEATNLSYKNLITGLSFRLYKGKVLGFHINYEITAKVLVDLLIGKRSFDSGELYLNQEKLNLKSVTEAFNKKINLIPEYDITFPNLSLNENLLLPNLNKMSNSFGVINKSKAKYFINIKSNRIRGVKNVTKSFMEKNILIQRVLGEEPELLIFVNPLKNMDEVSSNMFIELVSDLTNYGNAAIIFSSSRKTLDSMCDQIIPL